MCQGFPTNEQLIGTHYTIDPSALLRQQYGNKGIQNLTWPVVLRQKPSIRHRNPQPIVQSIISNLRNCKITLPILEIYAPTAQPTWHTGPFLKLRMEAQTVPDTCANITGPEIVALDFACLSYMGHGREPVTCVDKVPACFLRNAILWEGVLAPVILDLGTGRQATARGSLGTRPV